MKEKILPKIIKDIGVDFHWNNEKVWKLNYPIEEIDINKLEWHFEIPFWNTKNGFYDLKPSEVIKNSEIFKEEHERTMKSDLSYPINLMKNKGKWLILDGLHRLLKAKILNYKKVKVRKIPISEIPNIIKEIKLEDFNNFLRDYEKASNSHDFKHVRVFIHEKATYEFTDGSFNGINEIQEAFEKTFNKIQNETYKIYDVKWLFIDTKCAVCKYKFHWGGVVEGKRTEGSGRGTNLIVEENGELKILHEHLSK